MEKKSCLCQSINFGVHKKHGGLELGDYTLYTTSREINNFRYEFQPEKFTRAGDFFVCVALLPPCFSYETFAISRKKFSFFLTDVIVTYVCESRGGFPRSERKSEKNGHMM